MPPFYERQPADERSVAEETTPGTFDDRLCLDEISIGTVPGEMSKEGSQSNRDKASWRIVALGLQLKLFALWGMAFSPIFGLLGLIFPALIIDFIGRCLCLASPIQQRMAIKRSVCCQAAGILLSGIVMSVIVARHKWRPDESLDLVVVIGMIVAIFPQSLAACFFTTYLSDVARSLGRPELESGIGILYKKLKSSAWAWTALVIYTAIIIVLAAYYTLMSWGLGIFVAVPFGVLALLPAVILTLWIFGAMCSTYNSTLKQIRRAVVEASSGRASPDE